jgi:sec-independent protein translocase protein TatA
MIGSSTMIAWLGVRELLVILAIAVFIFGAGRIPEIARSLRKSVQEFKKVGKEAVDDADEATEDDTRKS